MPASMYKMGGKKKKKKKKGIRRIWSYNRFGVR